MSQIKIHIEKYGPYGIGLSQEWGRANGLNPVLYVDKNSAVGANYRSALKDITKGKQVGALSENDTKLMDILRYMKNYEADLVRKQNTTENYRFADEKEWRYVPDKDETAIFIPPTTYKKEGYKDKINDSTARLRLTFEPKDIKYVIIKDESEVSEFINVMRTTKGEKYTHGDVERLMTRLITVEQIKSDF